MKRWLPLLLIFVSATAFAADPSAQLGLGSKLMDRFAEILSGFEAVLRSAALSLFIVLLLIENSVWGIKQIVNESLEAGSLALKLGWNFIVWGFFAWLIKDSHDIMSSIIATFFKLGQDATGLGPLDVSGMLSLGVNTALAIPAAADLNAFSFLDKPLIVLTAIIAEIMMLAAFFVTAAQLVMAQVEAMIVIAAAPILLAFGALSFTRDIATKVLSHALGTGVKILTIYIIAGVMAKIGPDFAAILKANGAQIFSSPAQLLEVIAVSGLMVILAFFVPSIASAMLSGSASLSGGAAIGGAMGAAAAGAAVGAAGIGALASTGGKAVGAATDIAAGATGIAKALGAGYSSGTDLGLGKLGAAAHSVGEVSKHGLGLMSSGVSGAATNAKSAFAEKVDASTGGKIASSIEATRGGSMSPASGSGAAPSAPATAASGSQASASGSATAPVSSASTPTTSSSSGSAGASAPNYVPPPADMGNASGASISGSGAGVEPPRSTLGKIADAASGALNATHSTLNRGQEHVIDDRAQVGAHIDTKVSH